MVYSLGYCHEISDADRASVSSFTFIEQEHLKLKPAGLLWDQCFLGILLTKRLCAGFLGLEEQDISIMYNSAGRPFVSGAYISISHCDDLVIGAVCKNPIGVDVERIRDNFPDMSLHYTTQEKHYLSEARDSQSFLERSCQLWTFKEAFFKSFGSGVSNLQAACYFDYQHLTKHIKIGQYYLTFFVHL